MRCVHIDCVLAFWQINILLFRLLSIIHHHSLLGHINEQLTITVSDDFDFRDLHIKVISTIANRRISIILNIINSSEYDYYYCMIVLLVKFTLFLLHFLYLCLPFIWWMKIIIIININFYCATLCVSAVFAVARCLSVHGSVCHVGPLYPDGWRYG